MMIVVIEIVVLMIMITINSEKSVTLNNCNILIIKLSNPNLKRHYQPEDTQENDFQLKLFSTTLTELQPNTAYNLRMKIFYDMSESLESKGLELSQHNQSKNLDLYLLLFVFH